MDYRLTDRGREVSELLVPLTVWVVDNADDILSGQDPTATR